MARTDEEIKKDVVDQLYWDSSVDASKVEVVVDHGIVTLRGSVPSYTSRTAAFSDAWTVSGVGQVVDNINVEYPTVSTDDEIRAASENILSLNPDIDISDIDISVEGGIVELNGNVDAYWKKSYAEELVSKVRGVVLVSNNLGVVPTHEIIDQDIANDIIAALERNMLVDSTQVDVKVADGIVTLSGTVPSWPARMAARNAAARTFGVVDVVDNLNVRTEVG